ncbi:MAG: Txe/YoeB family addiction module toxin [Candidatus Aminicenantes bacterium]|nr:MAG: Txe/YoeB family addiction module toxin [Candidatus Aminicenantes bacterium]
MVNWRIVYTKQALKDARKLSASGLRSEAESILEIIKKNPFKTPPPFEKLIGDLTGAYSRRINNKHRIIYQVLKKHRTIKIIRMWTHYE